MKSANKPGRPGKTSVLVVDDDEDIRATIREILEGEGFAVLGAANGRDALELLLAEKNAPALILLDLLMPEMDGWAFRREQQKNPKLSGIPVVVFSARDDLDQSAQSMKAAAHMHKPVEPADLLSLIGQLSRNEKAN